MQKVVTISQFTRSDQSNHTKTEQESYKSYHIQIGYVSNQEYRNGERNAWNAGNVGNVIFPGMSPNIPGNVAKYSGEYHQKFRGTSPNIPGNVADFWCKGQGCIQNPVKHPRWSSSAKIANGLNTLTISAIKLHGRCSTGFHMRL